MEAVDSKCNSPAVIRQPANTLDSAFKFLPVLPKYVGQAFKRQLPAHLAKKWRFRTDYQHDKEAFLGDGSRGGPERREFDGQERAKL